MDSQTAAVARLKAQVDDAQVAVFALEQKLANKKEDLDSASDALINNLQMLKGVEARLSAARNRLEEHERSGGAEAAQQVDSLTLERMLVVSKKPWETSDLDLSASRGNPNFERAVVAELSRVAARLNQLGGKLEDPFKGQRQDIDESRALLGRDLKGSLGGAAGELEEVEVVRESGLGDHAVVCVNVASGQTFQGVLDYVTSYWSLESSQYALFDSRGYCWPLEAKVRETIQNSEELGRPLQLKANSTGLQQQEEEEIEESIAAGPSGLLAYEGDAGESNLGGTGGPAAPSQELQGTGAAKKVRFSSEERGMSNRIESNLSRLELEHTFRRGYSRSLALVRHHCETFFFLLLLSLVFTYSLFANGVYDSLPVRQAVEGAFIQTPFASCDVCVLDDQDARQDFSREDNFESVATVSGVFSFLKGPVLELLSSENGEGNAFSSLPVVQEYNVLVGKVMLQQQRVQDDCVDNPPKIELSPSQGCFPPYQFGDASEEPFSVGLDDASAPGFSFLEEFPGPGVWPGFVSGAVNGVGDRFDIRDGGYYVELDMDRATMQSQIDALIQDEWVDAQSRAVYVNFNLYNPNTDLFAVFVGLFQITTSNGVIPSYFVVPTRVTGWEDNASIENGMLYTALAIYGMFFLLFAADFLAAKDKLLFLRSPQSLVDLLLLVLLVVTISFAVSFNSKNADLRRALTNGDFGNFNAGYTDLRGLAFGQSSIRALQGSIVILTVLKGMAFLRNNPEVSLLGKTARSALSTLNNFVLLFLVITLAFAIAGHFLLGRNEFLFHQFDLALYSVVSMIFGMFDLAGLSVISKSSIWTTVFILFVYLVGFFALLRLFIAIIAHSYSSHMDLVRRKGFFWIPASNQEYRIHPPNELKRLRKVQVTQRFGIPSRPPR